MPVELCYLHKILYAVNDYPECGVGSSLMLSELIKQTLGYYCPEFSPTSVCLEDRPRRPFRSIDKGSTPTDSGMG